MEDEASALWFRAVYAAIRQLYVASKRTHLVSFLPSTPCFADAMLDGQGGSALLTELLRFFGKDVLLRRDFFKRMVLLSARELGFPVQRMPSGGVMLGVRAMARRPRHAHAVILRRLPLPGEVRCGTLAQFLGESWWAVRSQSMLRAAELPCYSANLPPPKKLLRAIFPFPCTEVRLSVGRGFVCEWHDAFLLVRTAEIWDFVQFLRWSRRKQRAEIIKIGGLGDVMV